MHELMLANVSILDALVSFKVWMHQNINVSSSYKVNLELSSLNAGLKWI